MANPRYSLLGDHYRAAALKAIKSKARGEPAPPLKTLGHQPAHKGGIRLTGESARLIAAAISSMLKS